MYKTQHERIIKLVSTIVERVGQEQAEQSVLLINALADAADEVISELQKGTL